MGKHTPSTSEVRAGYMFALRTSAESQSEIADEFDRWLDLQEPSLRSENARVQAELDRLHSWAGLMELLDEHWPEDIFPALADDADRDSGPRIVSLIRWVERLRGAQSS